MTIPSTAWEQTFLGQPPMIFNASARKGNTTRIRKLLLDQIDYEPGGFPLEFPDTCLSCIFDACLLLVRDPNACEIPCPVAVPCIKIDATGKAKMELWVNGAEAPAGWTGPAGSYLWISFTGVS